MNVKNLLAGFTPLALYALATPLVGPGLGAVIGLAAAVVVVLTGLRQGVKILPAVTAVILAGLGVAALVGDAGTDEFLTDYGRGVAGLVLGGYILVTARFAPFTAQFARQAAPERVWHSRAFLDLNTRISAAWGAAVVAASVAHIAAATLPEGQPGARLLSWGGLAVSILLALRFTRRAAENAQSVQRPVQA